MGHNVHEAMMNAQRDVLVREDNPLLHDAVCRLRSAIIDGLCDHIVIPDISTDNGMAAHELLGCPLYTGLLNVVNFSAEIGQEQPEVGEAIRKVVVESITGMARRLITEGQQVLREEYGAGHIH